MMASKIDVVIIFCMVGNTKQYVASTSRRFDKKIVPQYTNDHLMAFRCEDESHAQGLIRDIHNNSIKTFQTEWITVEREPIVKFGSLVTADVLVRPIS